MNPHIFRAYDIRGKYNDDFTVDDFYRIGQALAREGQSVMVGNDTRESSEELAKALISGLKSTGAQVRYCGTVCFGECLFAGWKENVDYTFLVTASHMPPEYNGLKMYTGDEKDSLKI